MFLSHSGLSFSLWYIWRWEVLRWYWRSKMGSRMRAHAKSHIHRLSSVKGPFIGFWSEFFWKGPDTGFWSVYFSKGLIRGFWSIFSWMGLNTGFWFWHYIYKGISIKYEQLYCMFTMKSSFVVYTQHLYKGLEQIWPFACICEGMSQPGWEWVY